MNLEKIITNSNLQIDRDKILFNESMKEYTTFKIGGPAECLIKIENEEDLKEIINFSNKNKIPLNIIGNGSNILVSDKGIEGITLIIKIEKFEINNGEENKIIVNIGSGEKMGKVARLLAKKDISGFEELSGIPGTLGGAVRMNAGAYGKEIGNIVKSVKCIDYNGKERKFTNREMEFGYRKSKIKEENCVITEVELVLEKGKKELIENKMQEYAKNRKEKQPIEFPNAGSVFKRGSDFITSKLIDEAGLKGYSIGGAEVSLKHSGFIINKGNATAQDVLKLIQYIKDEVYKKFNKKIELEIEYIGE